MIDKLLIFSDASYSKESSLSVLGYAYSGSESYFLNHKDLVLTPAKSTNNIRAEIESVLLALSNSPKDVEITLYTDCANICGLIERRQKLEKANFISKSKKTEIKNADLYREFYKLFDVYRPEIIWVKGHMQKIKQTNINKNFSILDKAVRSELRSIIKTSSQPN